MTVERRRRVEQAWPLAALSPLPSEMRGTVAARYCEKCHCRLRRTNPDRVCDPCQAATPRSVSYRSHHREDACPLCDGYKMASSRVCRACFRGAA